MGVRIKTTTPFPFSDLYSSSASSRFRRLSMLFMTDEDLTVVLIVEIQKFILHFDLNGNVFCLCMF